MGTGFSLPDELAEQIEAILAELLSKAGVECVLLADVSGQLINAQGEVQDVDPVVVATLAAGDLAAMTELTRQIGEDTPHGSFLHEGESRSIYLFSVAGSLILIVIFKADTPVGLVRLFVRRAAERLHPLTGEFEEIMTQSRQLVNSDFGAVLAEELDRAFEGL